MGEDVFQLVRDSILARMQDTPAAGAHDDTTFGLMFEDYLGTFPVNTYSDGKPASLGAYMSVLDFVKLEQAIREILDVAFDKFGFMLEWIQTFEYLSPTFSMIASTMRRAMPEYA